MLAVYTSGARRGVGTTGRTGGGHLTTVDNHTPVSKKEHAGQLVIFSTISKYTNTSLKNGFSPAEFYVFTFYLFV